MDYPSCADGCSDNMVGNGVCESECVTRSCRFDGGDCASMEIAPGCYQIQIADGVCDQDCNNDLAYWDGWDCACGPGCTPVLLGNYQCDLVCDTSACNYDAMSCEDCATGCTVSMLGNGVCDPACINLDCSFDLGDCDCAPGCTIPLLENTVCDSVCNNAQCGNDNGICENCSPGCTASMRHNGICDSPCETEACNYDDSDCICSSGCLPVLLSNAQCDSECDTFLCAYDNSECLLCDSGCQMWMLGDGKCDSPCDNSQCAYDNSDCLCSIGCTPALLANSVCDAECDNLSCNYDNSVCVPCTCTPQQLNNGQCDLSCNTATCNYDNGACLCPEACTLALLSNTVCDSVCNTPLCGYDNNVCTDCAEGCSWSSVGDGTCEVPCMVPECLFDGSDCSCSKSCEFFDLLNQQCDSGCDSPRCSSDNSACIECAAGCYLPMLNDGFCDAECYVESCGYDLSDCECPPSCSTSSSCSYQCITLACQYSKELCETGEVLRTLVNSALLDDLGAVWDPSACVSVDSECIYLMLNSVCDSKCNVEQCLYDLGGCSTCSNTLCVRCVDSICVECIAGYYALMGQCLTNIPRGFTIYPDYPYFLIPHTDVSTMEYPTEIYVSPTHITHIEDGSFQNPYSSLSVALATISSKFSVVYLLDGYHYLTQVDLSRPDIVFMNSSTLPLSTAFVYRHVMITTLLCENSLVTGCATSPAVVLYMDTLVTLSVKYAAALEITNVVFNGAFSLDSQCFREECTYCPYYFTTDGVDYNDKEQAVDLRLFATSCGGNSGRSFIEFEEGGSLVLTNVTFTEFRQQMTVLKLIEVNAVLVNVSFVSVQAASNSAVVVQEGGSFVWVLGMVEFLNYGYEYIKDLELGGFLQVSNAVYMQLQYLIFQWNTVFSGSVVSVSNTEFIIIEECFFTYNWANSIIAVKSDSMEYLQHFILRSTSFLNNTSNSGSLVGVSSSQDLRTVLIDSCEFSYNYFAGALGAISLVSQATSAVYQSEVLINNVQFSENYGGAVQCIDTHGLSSILISNIQVLPYTGNYISPSQPFVDTSISLGYYISQQGGLEFSDCSSVFLIENTKLTANLTAFLLQQQFCENILSLISNKQVRII